MKTYNNIESSRSLIFDEQLFQKTNKVYQVVNETNLTVDLNLGNYQTIDLSNSGSQKDINILLTSPNTAIYYLVILNNPDRSNTVRIQNQNFIGNGFFSTDSDKQVLMFVYNGSEYISIERDKKILQYSTNRSSYDENDIVIFGGEIFIANQDTTTSNGFNIASWDRLSTTDANNIDYNDIFNTGNTNVQTALNSLFSNPRFIASVYNSIDDLLAARLSHTQNTAYLVVDVSLGLVRDERVTSGFAIYTLSPSNLGSILDYYLVGGENINASYIHFDNSVSSISNDPQTVQLAIDEIYSLLNSFTSGSTFIGNWNAETNTPILGNNGKFSDGTTTGIITSVDLPNQTISINNLLFLSGLSIGDSIKNTRNNNNFTINSISSLANTLILGLTKDDGLAFVSDDLVDNDILVGISTRAETGSFYYVTSNTNTITIDGISDYNLGDKIISNGSSWLKQTNSLSVTARNVSFDTIGNNWAGVDPVNVAEALNNLNTRIGLVNSINSLVITINFGQLVPPQITSSTQHTTGELIGLTSYIINHNLGTIDFSGLNVEIFFQEDGGVFEKIIPDTLRQSGNNIELIIDTLTTGESYRVSVREL